MNQPIRTGHISIISYNHPEAFNLMQYRDDVTGEIEILWNSRDGVTPFMIESRRGNNATHFDWHADIKVPDFKPCKGMRIFVDALPTHPHIIKSANDYVDKYWDVGDPPMKDVMNGMSREQAVAFFIKGWTEPGSPTVIEVE